MKKVLILTACFSIAFAEEIPPSELQAKQEIENFLIVPDSETADLIPRENVELSLESPEVAIDHVALPVISQPEPTIVPQILLDPEEDIAAIEKQEKEIAAAVKADGIIIDLGQVFSGSPTIYTILFFLSIASLSLGAYAFATLRTPEQIPANLLKEVREKLMGKHYDEALNLCSQNRSILFQMVASGIQARNLGTSTMLDLMKAEGKRASSKLWQRISLLSDIAVIAPMLGLLGTVLGMFYAFYDLNRSMESISALFDGLGISVGTTVGGLIVAILALVFHSMTKQRLMQQLIVIENEASSLANLIETQERT